MRFEIPPHDGVYQQCVDHDDLHAKLTFTPAYANDLDITTLDGKDELNKLMYSRYEGDSLNVIPSCDCGLLHGARFLSHLCKVCNTKCEYITEKALESLVWIRAPRGIKRLISPTAWIILSNAWSFPSFHLLEWLTNPMYVVPPKVLARHVNKLNKYLDYGIERGLNSFVANFDEIVDIIYSIKLVDDSGPYGNDTRTWIKQNRSVLFPMYLPVPSKVGFVVEDSGSSNYIDSTITLAVDAIRTIIAIESAAIPQSPKRTQANTVSAIKILANYYLTFATVTLGGKPGIFRKHVFGGSLQFTARAVISSISHAHNHQELHLPWSMSIQLLKLHIAAILLKPPYRYTPTEINNLCRDYALRYHPVLDEVMCKLIEDTPHVGIPCIFQRNPSLNRGSAQLFYISRIKTDTSDQTIGFPIPVIRACNADFDGDEMNLMLILDFYTYERLSRLKPHLYALDTDNPRRVSRHLDMPGPVVRTASAWLYKGK